jgi:hypothetical protein
MKPLFTLLILCCCSIYAQAQNKIVITYDENGNRIQRELICPGCRPADTSSEDPGTPGDQVIAITEPELASKVLTKILIL